MSSFQNWKAAADLEIAVDKERKAIRRAIAPALKYLRLVPNLPADVGDAIRTIDRATCRAKGKSK